MCLRGVRLGSWSGVWKLDAGEINGTRTRGFEHKELDPQARSTAAGNMLKSGPLRVMLIRFPVFLFGGREGELGVRAVEGMREIGISNTGGMKIRLASLLKVNGPGMLLEISISHQETRETSIQDIWRNRGVNCVRVFFATGNTIPHGAGSFRRPRFVSSGTGDEGSSMRAARKPFPRSLGRVRALRCNRFRHHRAARSCWRTEEDLQERFLCDYPEQVAASPMKQHRCPVQPRPGSSNGYDRYIPRLSIACYSVGMDGYLSGGCFWRALRVAKELPALWKLWGKSSPPCVLYDRQHTVQPQRPDAPSSCGRNIYKAPWI